MKKRKQAAYTHPRLAEHFRELFAQGTAYGWGGLEHHMEQAVPKTIEEMVANGELVIKDNLIQLLPRGIKRNLSTKKIENTGNSSIGRQKKLKNGPPG